MLEGPGEAGEAGMVPRGKEIEGVEDWGRNTGMKLNEGSSGREESPLAQ